MKLKFIFWSVRVLIFCLIAFSLYYTFDHWTNADFFTSFWSSWLATMFGVLISVPIALELSRLQYRAELKKKEADDNNELAKKSLKILSLLKIEIDENIDKLKSRIKEENGIKKRVVIFPALKNDLWRAFSDGGELQWIKDVDLLDAISSSYHSTSQVIFLEAHCFEISHYPGMRLTHPEIEIIKYLTELDEGFTNSMQIATNLIAKKILTIQNIA
jgi:hypothetical protein